MTLLVYCTPVTPYISMQVVPILCGREAVVICRGSLLPALSNNRKDRLALKRNLYAWVCVRLAAAFLSMDRAVGSPAEPPPGGSLTTISSASVRTESCKQPQMCNSACLPWSPPEASTLTSVRSSPCSIARCNKSQCVPKLQHNLTGSLAQTSTAI